MSSAQQARISRWHGGPLRAAGVLDPQLQRDYEHCRLVNADYGKTYYLAALLLPADRRPHVYALYAFARVADEFIDNVTAPDPIALAAWGAQALRVLSGQGTSADPVLRATAATVQELGLDVALFEDFLKAMQQDETVSRYETYSDLQKYMWGSASVIGLMMLPILKPRTEQAAPHAIALGEAFQMANFIRDIGEDLTRGRIYLPLEDLRQFNVTENALRSRVCTPEIKELISFEIQRTRKIFDFAALGIGMVDETSRPCLSTALTLYGGILTEVERANYDILAQRVTVSKRRRAAVAIPALGRAVWSRSRVR